MYTFIGDIQKSLSSLSDLVNVKNRFCFRTYSNQTLTIPPMACLQSINLIINIVTHASFSASVLFYDVLSSMFLRRTGL